MAEINASPAIERFEGVKTRLLGAHERPFSTVDQGTPLVIEPGSGRGVSALSAFLAASSEQVKQALYAHGALLFRGFSLDDEAALERAVRAHALVQSRDYATPDDVQALAVPVLAHRVRTTGDPLDRTLAEAVIRELLQSIPVPL